MIYAYDEIYVDEAMQNLGEAFDYAVNACGLDIDEFMNLFLATGLAESFSTGNPKYLVGLSGTELAMCIINKAGLNIQLPPPQIEYDFSPEYWTGYVLAYFQWKSARSFKNIYHFIKMKDIVKLYPALHEAPEDKFFDCANAIINKNSSISKIQEQRKHCGYSQRELADKSGVNLRTLQQYESKAKDINKAAVFSVLSIANALGCKITDILEL